MARSSAKLHIVEDPRLSLLKDVTELIDRAKSLKLSNTVFLLKIAQLDLQTSVYDISDKEMDAFLAAARLSDADR